MAHDCHAPVEVEKGALVGYALSGNLYKALRTLLMDFSALKNNNKIRPFYFFFIPFSFMLHCHFLSFPVCTCNGFAEACTFDATKDHGVCTTCQSNTAGDFCDSCVEGFYINPEHATDSSLPYCLRKD